MQKLLLIQPHSDDVLLSCSHFLFNPEYKVEVLTVENDPKRIEEDKKLYGFLNIPYHHLDIEFTDDSYYGYYKEFKEMSDENSQAFLDTYYGQEKLDEINKKLIKFLNDFQDKKPDYRIVSPLGIGHPFHNWVFGLLQCYGLTEMCYREFPHSYKRKAKLHFSQRVKKYALSSTVNITDFADIKWKLASKFYRSQSGLLFYEQGYIKKNLPEEIYSPIINPEDLPF